MGNPAFKFVSAGNLRALFHNPDDTDSNNDGNVYNVYDDGMNGMPYNTDVIFNSGPQAGVQVNQSSASAVNSAGAAVDPGYVNQNVTVTNVYSIVSGAVSIQVLQKNLKRTMIIIQNQSTTGNLWYSFGKPAQVNQCPYLISSQTIGLDYTCPPDSVYLYFDGTAGLVNPCVITEISTLG